jgi:predicted dehydrogenase
MGEVNIEAARRGCHIITEKPIALSMEELNTLRTELNKTGKRLTALLPFRQMGPFVAAHQAVKKGMIGEPLLISAQKSYLWGGGRPDYFKTRKEYGGSIPWVAIHAIDFIRFVTGLEYVEVTARQAGKTLKKYPECEDCGVLLFVMNNGGQASITFDYLRPTKALSHADDRIRVAGSEGVVEVRSGNPPMFCELMTQTTAPKQLAIPETKANLLVDFVAELRGGPPVWVSQGDAFRATEVALKARNAADAKTTVAL